MLSLDFTILTFNQYEKPLLIKRYYSPPSHIGIILGVTIQDYSSSFTPTRIRRVLTVVIVNRI